MAFLRQLPKTPSGKIDRRELTALAEASSGATGSDDSADPADAEADSPRTSVEEIVAKAWAEVLGTDRFGLGQSFFDLGGHSLLAGKVLSRLRTAFGVDLALRSFFAAPTVRGLAEKVEEARSRGEGAEGSEMFEGVERGVLRRSGGSPLSFAQERLLFFERLAPGTALYNMPALLEISGPLQLAPLAAALDEIVRRHETLRTVFGLDASGEEPVQHVLPFKAPFKAPFESPAGSFGGLAVVDLSHLGDDLARHESERLLGAEVRRPFSLERGPLFRALLLRLPGDESRLILHAHHIVSDGWSLGVLHEELGELYTAFSAGRPSPLPDLPLRYADFAVWQRGWLQGEVLESQLSWWQERLANLPEPLDLPADRPRPAEQSYRGAILTGELPAGLSQAMLQLGRRHGATPFMVFAAAYFALIQRHTHRDDLVMGFPTANRTRPEIEPLIGFFVNTLVLRADLSGDPSFLDILARVRDASLGAWAHQDLPFERLVEALSPERDLARSPIFQILFTYQGSLGAGPDLGPGLTVRARELDTGISKFDLSVFLREETGGKLGLDAEYSTDLFDAATVRGLLDRFEVLLGGIAAAPETRLGDLPVLTAAERGRLLGEWSGSEPAYPREVPIHRHFERLAESRPEAPAVLWESEGEERALTYGELAVRARRIARYLKDLGVGPETPVALDLGRSPELIAALVGVLQAGGIYIPLDPSDSSERRAHLLENSRAAVVLKLEDIQAVLADTTSDAEPFESSPLGGDAVAHVLYTSGSTGRPKGVAVAHRGVNRLLLETDYIRLGPGDRLAHVANTAFDAATLEVWGALITGGSVVVIPREVALSPAALGQAFRRWKISASFLTAALFNEVLREAPGSLGGVRNQLAGGEALSPRWVKEALSQLEPGDPRKRLLNGYGPTECTVFAVVHDIRSVTAGRSIPIGRPIANTRAYVVDRALRLVPPGVEGRLLLGGDGLARGYWGRPDLTAERFLPSPFGPAGARLYDSGDLARWLADGTLEYLGRADDQVKIRGFRIEPGEIESVLSRCPGVGECAVVAAQAAEGKILVAFATRADGTGEGPVPDVRAWLREHLPEFLVPSRVAFLDTLPRTSSGKVDRRALLALPLALLAPLAPDTVDNGYEAPRTPVQEIVAGVWIEVLGVERVGLGERFFDLGGHSLLAGRVLGRLRAILKVDVPLRDFFVDPTVEGLARWIEEARRLDAGQPGKAVAPALPSGKLQAEGSGFPLSFAQQRLWLSDRLAPGLALYNMPAAMRIAGPLQVGVLAAALDEIVRRHESLRTVFGIVGDEPVQRILPAPAIPGLAVVDLSGLPEPLRDPEAALQERGELRRPFRLETGPLFRLLLIRTGAQEHLLILNTHHIVSDGWSLGVLCEELDALYPAFAVGLPSPLPEPAMQYTGFAAWQREWLEAGALSEQLAWWKVSLAGLPGGLDLPADRPRPAAQSYRGAMAASELAAGLSQAVHRLGRQHGATPFMTFAAAFLTLIHRHTGREDLAVGFPTANRTRPEIEPLIGFFVNTLVLRVDLSGEPGFLGLLGRVREAALGAWAHQDLPFERLVEALAPVRDPSRSPLVQILFSYQDMGRLVPRLSPDLSTASRTVDTGTAKFDLSLFLQPNESGDLAAEVEYSTDLFDVGTVRRFLDRLETLLEGIAAVPDAALGDLPLLTAGERGQLLGEQSGVEREYPSELPVHRTFEAVAARQPGAPAVIWDTPEGEQSLSYGELARDAARLARHLKSLGVGPGVAVALDMPRSAEMITAMIAVLQAGGFYVPLDPTDASERRSFLVEDSGARIVLKKEDVQAGRGGRPGRRSSPLGGDAIAYMIYTSGSTGRPKGVAVPHRAINRLVLETGYFTAGPGDRITNLVNMTFDVSTWEVWGGLLRGAAVVVVPRELVLEPPVLADWLVKMRADICFLPVSVFNEIARERPSAFTSIRELFSGGEALSPHWVRQALPHIAPGHRLVDGYGPTEVTCWALTHTVESLEEGRSVPIGRPIPNTTAFVLDRELRLVPVGVPGELCLGGPGVAQGYWRRPDLTADRFVPDPFGEPGQRLYRTGDLARWLADGISDGIAGGIVEYLGRTDHQVKIRGYRIEPGEIESVLARCPGVAECAVVVIGGVDGAGGKSLAAFVLYKEEATEADVRSWLRERLPEYMVPAQVQSLDALPKSSSGKIDRRALQAIAAQEDGQPAAPVRALRTPVEEIVAGAWAEVLGVERVGPGESFFDLGGHSLLAGRVLARLRTVFGVDLPLQTFFREPTVDGLARRVEEARRAGGDPGLPPIQRLSQEAREGPIPLSFAQQRLWFFDRLAPGSALYNMPVPMAIQGPLDVATLAAAVGEIVRRHESLRTVFTVEGDEPAQTVLPEIPGLSVMDLSGLAEPVRREEAERQEREELIRPFSLETGPLFRTLLLRLSPDEHRLILNAHHIVSDGWSMTVIADELEALYPAFATGLPSPLPELAVQYADFAVWQREWLRGEVLDAQLSWWMERLAGLPEGLDLPADHPRPAVQSYRGEVEKTVIPAAVADGMLGLGRRHGATPFMTFAAVWLALIHRHTHGDDLAVGFPTANRTRPEIEPLIGYFVNTLVLRADLSGQPSFLDLLGRVREAALGAWAHQDLPFERLVEALAPERDLSRSPLFQLLFAYQGAIGRNPVLGPGLSARLEETDTGTAKFDLGLFLREAEGAGLDAGIEYATDLFDRATVRRLLERFEILLAGIVETPESGLADLPLLPEAERRQILDVWSGSEPAYPRETPVHRVFEQVAARQPDAPAVLWDSADGEQTLTYGELDRRSSALARRLRARGVGPETPVALEMERSPGLVTALVAVLKAGAFYVPLDSGDSSERHAYQLEDSRATVVLRAEDLAEDDVETAQTDGAGLFESSPLGDDALACVLYTSGSTGRPKGVAVPHHAINRLILETDYLRLGPGDRTAHLSNTAFDAVTFEVWGALLTGAALVVLPREVVLSPVALGAAFRRWKISASFLTVALFNEVMRQAPGSLGGVRTLLTGGEVLTPRWVREGLAQLESGGPRRRLLNGYGPTECTTYATTHDIRSVPEGQSIPIGRPIANTRAWVVDRAMRLVPQGVAGELLLGGDGLARGYHGRPDLSAERFVPALYGEPGARAYRTGDLVRWLADGTLEYLGRTDDQVKIRGFRIEPGEIESVLSRCPGIGDCAVVVRQEGETKSLLAFATRTASEEGSAPTPPDTRGYLRERLPEHMVPSRVIFLDSLPRTSSGKVDRRALLGIPVTPAGIEAEERPFLAPRTPVEQIVAGVLAEILGVERIGLGESFFDLGGHSLLASRALARLRSAFGIELPLRSFFLEPTVDGIARRFETERRSGAVDAPPISPVPRDQRRDRRLPLSFAQERLWLVDQLQPGNAAYNSFLPLAFSGGPLDGRALEAALQELIARHEALRTRFVSGPGGPEQIVDPPPVLSLPRVDLMGLAPELRSAERLRLVVDEAYRPFDLARGPVVRATLVLREAGENDLLLNFHHIVCDGWSLTEVLSIELAALYRAFLEGRPSPRESLPPLPIQYPDFAVWQREWLEGGALQEQLAWWQETLGGEPPVLDLPYDRPRPATLSPFGTVEMTVLPAELGQALSAFGRRHGATLFMTLLAAIQTLLQRYSHEDRIAVGTAVGNRSRQETEGLIGLFLNTLVLQTDLSGDPSFSGLLERVRDVTLDAFDHQDLPFERLVAAVQGSREPGRSPLFQVLFLLQNMKMTPMDLPGITTGMVDYPSGRVQFDLAFTAFEWDEGLIFAVPYSTDLFDRPTILRLIDHSRRLLEHLVRFPESPLSEAPILSDAERHQVTLEWPHPGILLGLSGLLDPLGRPVPIGVVGEVQEDGQPTGRRARWRPDGTLKDAVKAEPGEAGAAGAVPEALEDRLDRRQQQLSDRLDKLSPERRSLLRKWIKKT